MSARLALALVLLAPAACADPAPAPPSAEAAKISPERLREYSRNLQDYTDAMLLCGSTSPADWEEAKHRFELLHPFFVFQEDPELIKQFKAGREDARKELAKRGGVLRAALTLSGAFDRAKWEEARKTLMAAGEPGQILLSQTLLQLLLNGQNLAIWRHIRFMLAESGPVALETTVALAKELANQTPAETAIFKIDDFVQVLMVIIAFGDAGTPAMEEMSRSGKSNVRRAVAKAIGESRDGTAAPMLLRLLEDPEWSVRATAAESAGAMASARAAVGPALVARIGKERDGKVLRDVLRSIGDLLYVDAVPDLIRVLEVPSRDTVEAAMQALYILTGEKFLKRELWKEWYQIKYPEWKKKHPGISR